jgi:hypothetical protein
MSPAPRRHLGLLAVVVALAAASLSLAPTSFGDTWGQDHAAAGRLHDLDPAIRTAIAAQAAVPAPVPASAVELTTAAAEPGFAWDDAAVGAVVGALALAALLACVTLVRHDGRLRNA